MTVWVTDCVWLAVCLAGCGWWGLGWPFTHVVWTCQPPYTASWRALVVICLIKNRSWRNTNLVIDFFSFISPTRRTCRPPKSCVHHNSSREEVRLRKKLIPYFFFYSNAKFHYTGSCKIMIKVKIEILRIIIILYASHRCPAVLWEQRRQKHMQSHSYAVV